MKSGKILIALLLVLPFLAAEAISAAEVSFYIGDVSLYRNSKKISPDMGMKLKSGDVIRTGKNSSVDIVYADSSTIKIAENSTARIGSASVKESDDIALVSGSLKGKFAKIKKGRHRVYTPTIICGIRGTEFSIGVEKGGTSRLDLDKGNIHVKNPYGERQVKPSEKVEAGVGEEPEDVENGSSIKDWKNKKEKEFMDDPEDRADDYSDYVPQIAKRKMLLEVEQPKMGKIKMPGTPIKMHGKPDSIEKASPLLGEDNEYVLKNILKYNEESIDLFRHSGII